MSCAFLILAYVIESMCVKMFKPLPVWVADKQQQMYQRIVSLPRR